MPIPSSPTMGDLGDLVDKTEAAEAALAACLQNPGMQQFEEAYIAALIELRNKACAMCAALNQQLNPPIVI